MERDWEAHDKKVTETSNWFMNGPIQEDRGPIAKRLTEYSPAIIMPGIYREFRPTHDRWEFTLYFRLGKSFGNSMKCRGDFELDFDEYTNVTEDRFFELCLLAVLDAGLHIVEQGYYRPDWSVGNES